MLIASRQQHWAPPHGCLYGQLFSAYICTNGNSAHQDVDTSVRCQEVSGRGDAELVCSSCGIYSDLLIGLNQGLYRRCLITMINKYTQYSNNMGLMIKFPGDQQWVVIKVMKRQLVSFLINLLWRSTSVWVVGSSANIFTDHETPGILPDCLGDSEVEFYKPSFSYEYNVNFGLVKSHNVFTRNFHDVNRTCHVTYRLKLGDQSYMSWLRSCECCMWPFFRTVSTNSCIVFLVFFSTCPFSVKT